MLRHIQNNTMKIPYLDLGKLNATLMPQIEQAAIRTLRSGQYLNESAVEEFEQAWAKASGAKYCISTANGLDALTAALSAMKSIYHWPEKSEVIVSAHTFIASFEAITRAGLTPTPCDASINDYNIDCDLITPLINECTVAIMPVHLYGLKCNIQRIINIAQKHNLKILIDSCQHHSPHDSSSKGCLCRPTSLPDLNTVMTPAQDLAPETPIIAGYSFYPGKNLGAMGDAGCLITDNEELADYARAFCNYGARIKYRHEIKGINSRMDAMQAAILTVKLADLDRQNKIRQAQAKRYSLGINNPFITLPYAGKCIEQSVWHIYPVFCIHRDKLQNYLYSLGISTLIHYPTPPHKQQAYKELNHLSLPITEQLCQTELSLPLNPALTTEQQDYIIKALNNFQP